MEQDLLTQVVNQGAWGCLFVWLLLTTQKSNKEREEKYQTAIDKNQDVIKNLAEKINIIEEIKEDVQEIKNKLN
ncbi:MAG: BhlA/UviB family holin-like peptide [Clostridium sp.]|uniref:BhlA/UviB family holin-like peptide n=1 Tax=Clostridium sp. TaxID=1506 RepID=UPI003F331508